HHARSGARGAPSDRLRDRDPAAGGRAALLDGRRVGRLCPAAGRLLWTGGAGVDGGCVDRHTRAVRDSPGECAGRAPRVRIRRVAAHIGRAVLGDRPVDVHSAELWVGIDPKANYDRTVAAIQGVVDGYPGLKHRVQTYLSEMSEGAVAGSQDRIVARVYGETEVGLRDRAEEVNRDRKSTRLNSSH